MVRLDNNFSHRRFKPEQLVHSPTEPHISFVRPPKGKRVVRRAKRKLFAHRAKYAISMALVIVVSYILNPKQTLLAMLTWIKDRLKEPSTFQGLTALAGAIGYTLNPEAVDAIVALVVAVLGAIQVLKTEKLVEKKDK